jgi:large subunit ribosomal protein L9
MRVILTADGQRLGKKGEVAEVKPGFARNYLMKKGLALPATPGALKDLQTREASKAKAVEKEASRARDLAAKVQALELKFSRPAGKDGRLFGSLTAQTVAAALKDKGLDIPKRQLSFAKPVKSAGSHSVGVKLHPQVTATLRITVEAKN